MDNNTLQEILKRVDLLGSKLSVGAGQLFSVLTAQAHVEGVKDLIAAGVLLGAASAGGYMLRKGIRGMAAARTDKSYNYSYNGPRGVDVALMTIGGITLPIFMVFAVFVFILPAITEFLNPQYWALTQLAALLK